MLIKCEYTMLYIMLQMALPRSSWVTHTVKGGHIAYLNLISQTYTWQKPPKYHDISCNLSWDEIKVIFETQFHFDWVWKVQIVF